MSVITHGCDGDNHVWTWADLSDEIPEGLPCRCGRFVCHYDACPTCGQKVFRAAPAVPEPIVPPSFIQVKIDGVTT